MRLNTMKVLSDSEVERIRKATSDILASTGVKIHSRNALEALAGTGADIDTDESIVRFPRDLQERCLQTPPREITLHNRDGKAVVHLGRNIPSFASGHNAVFFEDLINGIYREISSSDVVNFAKVVEQLDDVPILGLPGSIGEIKGHSSLLHTLALSMRYSTKPLFFSTDSAAVNHAALDMAEMVLAPADTGKAYMISQLSPTSPLQWETGAVEGVIECACRNFPVAILPEPIAGITAPYSVSGLITLHNAEALSGVFITQLINPGAPVIWASSWTSFDMKQSCALVGSVETSLARIGGTQVARSYDLPVHTTAPNSDNHTHDEQNSWEKSLSAFCAAAAGNDIIVNCGMYACGMSISLEQLVMDAEIAGQVLRLCRGIDASPDMIAANLITSLGSQAEYITAEHTMDLLHTNEHREPLIAVRGGRETWNRDGRADSLTRSRDTVDRLLAVEANEADPDLLVRLENRIKKFEKDNN